MQHVPLRINFVLPGFSNIPIGGYKVVYQYANALSNRGHAVKVVHPPWCNIKESISPANFIRQQIKMAAGPLAARRLAGERVAWFPLDEKVEQVIVPDIRERYIPDSDTTIATAWTTAPWVASYSKSKGRGYYLIQHYEAWDGLSNAVDKTWMLPLQKIVIAKWLLNKAIEFGESERTTYIPNGLDIDRFRLTRAIEDRPNRVLMLGHKAAWKGMNDGVKALEIVRGILSDVLATIFGTDSRPDSLPKWIDYIQLPTPESLTQLMNDSAIFLHPSWTEGLPAPPAEAMACGCALVAAANDGVLDYVTEGVTGLVAPIKNPQALADCMIRLLEDTRLRSEIAKAGHEYIQRYSWDKAVDQLENLLLQGRNSDTDAR
jgi:glycosyltransferase involved in cell wall biosynthesis